MCVEDRVLMGDQSRERYDPSKDVDYSADILIENAATFPPGFNGQRVPNTEAQVQVLIENFDQDIALEVVRNIESAALEDEVEWQRLQLALKKWKGRESTVLQQEIVA